MYETGRVVIRADDLASSVAFYTVTLGLKLVTTIEGRWAEIAAPDLSILLVQRLPGQPDLRAGPPGLGVGLWVPDIEKGKADLESRGVVFEGEIVDLHLLRVAFFNDPNGHQLILCQVREDTPVSTD